MLPILLLFTLQCISSNVNHYQYFQNTGIAKAKTTIVRTFKMNKKMCVWGFLIEKISLVRYCAGHNDR